MKLIFFFLLGIITSKTIKTKDLSLALSQSSPGDTIELLTGTYSSTPYSVPSGTTSNPITLRAAQGASVTFTGTSSNCIFHFSNIKNFHIEGPFELKNALCGIKAMDVTNVKISNLKIHDTQQHGIVISGENNEVSYNEIYNCVLENKYVGKTKEYGWSQCVAAWGKNYNNLFSKGILFKNNKIYNAYGEGLDFLKCDNCSSISNEITNGFSMNIYLDASRNIILDKNILRVTSDEYDTKWGSACGIGLASESGNEYNIDNVLITNNIIIGTRMAIYFFQIGRGGYNKIKILHNTMWNVGTTTLWFKQPDNNPIDCELKNNLIYIENWIADFLPKSSWKIGNNYYYNVYNVPDKYYDTEGGSKAAKNTNLNDIFNNNGNCNYFDKNIDVNCLRPKSKYQDDWFNLYKTGSVSSTIVNDDFFGCERSNKNPSIGALEYSKGCSEEKEEEGESDLIIKFKINYCTNNNDIIKLTGSSFGKWSSKDALIMKNEGNCNWSVTIENIPTLFKYKFVVCNGNNIKIWESGNSNRIFDLNSLKRSVANNKSGIYQNCQFEKNGNLVVLNCIWNKI